MPIYEYQCEDCGHEFETLQKLSDAPLRDCPKCHHERLVKKITAAAFRLKGGGWYETDFKSGGKRNVAGDGNAPAATGGSDSKSGSDSKGGGDAAPASANASANSSASSSASSSSGGSAASGGAAAASAD